MTSCHRRKISSFSLQVGGYSTLSTLVLIFNLLILFSVAKNKYLHYTTHYVMVTLALRSVLYDIEHIHQCAINNMNF